MKRLLVLTPALMIALTACKPDKAMDSAIEMKETTTEMKQQVAETNRKMEKMTSAVHKQTLLATIDGITKNESLEKLVPIPSAIMPYAETFAEEVTAEEIVKITYLWLKEIDEVMPMDNFDNAGENPIAMSNEKLNQVRKEKVGKLQALYAIAGFLPEKTMHEMIEQQIAGQGRFEETALQVLMMRYVFIRDILLKESLFAQKIDVVGEAEEAAKYIAQMEQVTSLPFAGRVALKTKGIMAPFENVNEKMDQKNIDLVLANWSSLGSKIDLDLKIEQKAITGNTQKDEQLRAEAQARLDEVKKKIESRKKLAEKNAAAPKA